MRIYDFLQYKPFLLEFMASFPKKGRGQALKLSKYLGVSSVVISQILKADRHFTTEQALSITEFYGFDERATEYFLNMVAKDKSGTHQLAQHYLKKLKKIQSEETQVKSRIVQAQQLTEIQTAQFYSNWFYSGVRLLSSIPEYKTIDDFASYLGLSRAKVREVVNFLIQLGLCVEENGSITMGPSATYLDPTSAFANNHRRNWRGKAIEKMSEPAANDLFYTSPMSLSVADVKNIRKDILAFVGTVSKRVADSPSETVACLNIDLFEF